MKTTVGNSEVVNTGVLVAHIDENVVLHPFSDGFALKIKIIYSEELKPRARLLVDGGPKESTIEFTNVFRPNVYTSNTSPISFAQDEDGKNEYLANIAIVSMGSKENYTSVINYTILSRKNA